MRPILSCIVAFSIAHAAHAATDEFAPPDEGVSTSMDQAVDLSADVEQLTTETTVNATDEAPPQELAAFNEPAQPSPASAEENEMVILDTSPQVEFLSTAPAELNVGGRPTSPAIDAMRKVEIKDTEVNWSFGIGVQYHINREAYPWANFQRKLARKLALGINFASLGELGTNSEFQGFQVMGSLDLNSQNNFRGLWLHAGGGITIVKEIPDADVDGAVLMLPTIEATIGWRWALLDANDQDDNFSFSLAGGVQATIGNTAFGGTTGAVGQLTFLTRAQVNFGF